MSEYVDLPPENDHSKLEFSRNSAPTNLPLCDSKPSDEHPLHSFEGAFDLELRWNESIAVVGQRQDISWSGSVLDFPPHRLDQDAERVARRWLFAPESIHQILMAQQFQGMLGEERQQLQFQGSEFGFHAAHPSPMFSDVHDEVANGRRGGVR